MYLICQILFGLVAQYADGTGVKSALAQSAPLSSSKIGGHGHLSNDLALHTQ